MLVLNSQQPRRQQSFQIRNPFHHLPNPSQHIPKAKSQFYFYDLKLSIPPSEIGIQISSSPSRLTYSHRAKIFPYATRSPKLPKPRKATRCAKERNSILNSGLTSPVAAHAHIIQWHRRAWQVINLNRQKTRPEQGFRLLICSPGNQLPSTGPIVLWHVFFLFAIKRNKKGEKEVFVSVLWKGLCIKK